VGVEPSVPEACAPCRAFRIKRAQKVAFTAFPDSTTAVTPRMPGTKVPRQRNVIWR